MRETIHFLDMLRERGIQREWVDRAVNLPDRVEEHEDGTHHFIKKISEYGDRWLRVVVDMSGDTKCLVTVFFDRRLR